MDNETQQIVTCKNCGNEFTGNYCNVCSQPANTHRINWKELLHHLPHAILHVDGGIFYTIKEMFLRPGYTMKEYFDGKRVRHFNPFLFVLISGGLYVYLFGIGNIKLINDKIRIEDVELFSSNLAHKFYLVPFFFFLIFFTVTDRLLYRKHNLIFPEFFVFNTYCAGEMFVLLICCAPFLYLQAYLIEHYDLTIIMRPIIKFGVLMYIMVARFQLFWNKGSYLTAFKIFFQVGIVYFSYEFLTAKMVELFVK